MKQQHAEWLFDILAAKDRRCMKDVLRYPGYYSTVAVFPSRLREVHALFTLNRELQDQLVAQQSQDRKEETNP